MAETEVSRLPFALAFAQSTVKSFEVCELPVRCAKFIVRKSWFIAASDDMHLRVRPALY